MQTWYECKVKYLKIDQAGSERKKTSTFLIDSVSFTDAETRIFEQMNEITSGEFQVTNIKKSNVTEIINKEEGEWYFKAKISLVTIDEEAGKEKKINNYILIMADDLDQATKRLHEGLSYMLIPYTVSSVTISPIEEVFPYDIESAAKEIPAAPTSLPATEQEPAAEVSPCDIEQLAAKTE